MWTHIRKLLAPPVFDDQDAARTAQVLNAILLSFFAVLLLIGGLAMLVAIQKLRTALALAAMFSLTSLAWFLMRRGYIRLAGESLVVGMWLVFTVLVMVSGGMTSVVAAFYLTITVMAGLIVGSRAALIVAGATSITGLGMVIAEQLGYSLPRLFPVPAIAGWIVLTFSLVLAITPLNLTVRGLVDALALTHQHLEARRQTEEALRESEGHYRLLFESNPFPMWVYDLETLAFLAVNDAAIHHYGYSRPEFLSMTIKDIRPPEDVPALLENVSRVTLDLDEAGVWRHRKKDGTLIDVEITSHTLDFAGRRAEVVLANGVTVRARMERVQSALYRISEAAQTTLDLDELYRSIHSIIGELMPATNFYIALYDAATDLLSMQYFVDQVDTPSPPGRLGKGLTAYVLRTGQPLLATRATIEQLVQDGQVELVGTPAVNWLGVPLKTQQGTIGVMALQTYSESARLWEADKDVLVFVSTQVALVIARKQAEQALRESEQRFRTLIEKSADVIAVLDERGLLSYQSASGEHVIGYTSDERKGQNAFDLLHPDDWPQAEKMFADLLNEPSESVTAQFRFRHKDGSWKWLEATGSNYLQEPTIKGLVVNYRDIDERKLAEGQIRKLNRTLRLINQVSQALVRTTVEAELLQQVCRVSVDIGGYRMAWVGLAEQDEARSVRPVAAAGYHTDYLDAVTITWDDAEHGRGSTGMAIRTGRPVAVRNMLTDPNYAPWREQAMRRGYAASIALPLVSEGRAFGALNIYAAEPDTFDAEEVGLLVEMADDLAYGIVALRTRAAHEQAEAARRESEERYRAVIEQSADGIYLIDPETKRVIEANAAFCSLLGYTPDQARRLTSFDIVEDTPQSVEARIKRIRQERRITFGERVYRRKDGSLVPVWVTGNMVSFGGQEAICTFVRDMTERKRAEEALRESERRMGEIVDNAPFGAHFYELKPGGRLVFVGANRAADQILGVANQQFVGKTVEEAFPPLSQTDIPDAYRRVAATGERYDVDQVDYAEGDIRGAFEVRAFQTGPNRMAAFFRDITERKRAEESLRASEDKFSKAFHTSPDSININRLSDGLYLEINQGFTDLTGYTAEEVSGKTSLELNLWANPEDRDRLIEGLREQGKVTNLEAQFRLKDGRVKTGLMSARIIQVKGDMCILSITRDITERKQAEEEIKRLNQDLERRARELAALNQAGQIMASTLDLNTLLERVMEQVGSLLDAEGASVLLCAAPEQASDSQEAVCSELVFAAVTGPAAQSLVGKRLPNTAGIATWVMREKQSALIADAQSDPRFYENIDAQSGLITRSVLAVPLISKGQVLGVVEAINKAGAMFDQHDLRVLEALCNSAAIAIENARLYTTEQQRVTELARALERQRELDRLQREFIQNVSHELRTPLALIRGHAEVLEGGWIGKLNSEQKESVSVISRRSQLLTKMVGDIISVLEIEQREIVRAPVNLAQLVRMSLIELRATAEQSDLVLSAEIEPGLPAISGDAIALRRVLENLVGNALKFTPAGGRVMVRLSSEGQAVKLDVTDTGTGIPSEHLGRIFERFYQVDGSSTRKYGGMGLGLSLVKSIVEAHGGRISVTSQVGSGTTLTVVLPMT